MAVPLRARVPAHADRTIGACAPGSAPADGHRGGARHDGTGSSAGRMTSLLPVHRSVFGGQRLADLRMWASEVEAWPAASHVWGSYYEETPAGPVPCRTENVSACHPGFRHVVEGSLREVAAEAADCDVVDFKDKINYKHPGGAGFSPHQDLTAYPGVSQVMSVLLALDECSLVSGCLWLATGVQAVLPTDERGVVDAAVAATLEWEPVEMAAGDVVCLHGLAPHFSRANTGPSRRRVLVASYAPTGEGYSRERYYRARQASMRRSAAAGSDARISTLDDFEGRRTSDGASRTTGACTHP